MAHITWKVLQGPQLSFCHHETKRKKKKGMDCLNVAFLASKTQVLLRQEMTTLCVCMEYYLFALGTHSTVLYR